MGDQPLNLNEILKRFEAGKEFLPGYHPAGAVKAGGMGMVLPAIDHTLGRKVAVKFIAPGLVGKELRQRFELEAVTLANCSHPSIPTVLSANLSGEPAYFTMPWIDGITVGAAVNRWGAFDCDNAARIAREVGLAIAHAHHLQILHRDLKPSNILLVSDQAMVARHCDDADADSDGTWMRRLRDVRTRVDGSGSTDRQGYRSIPSQRDDRDDRWMSMKTAVRINPSPVEEDDSTAVEDVAPNIGSHAIAAPIADREGPVPDNDQNSSASAPSAPPLDRRVPRLLDFGLAETFESAKRLGPVSGTPGFLAPEQLDGCGGDARTDVFGVGALLYFMLSGRSPVSVDLTPLRAHRGERPYTAVPLASIAPSVDRSLAAIVHRCLEEDPDDRYQTAAALCDDLQRFRDGVPVDAVPIGRPQRIAMWVKRNRAVSGFLAASILLSIGLCGAGVSATRHAHQAMTLAAAEREAHRQSVQAIDRIRWRVLDSQMMLRPEMQPIYSDLVQLLLSWHTQALRTDTRSAPERIAMADRSLALAETLRQRGNLENANEFLAAMVNAFDRVAPDQALLRQRIESRAALLRGLLSTDVEAHRETINRILEELHQLENLDDQPAEVTLARYAQIRTRYRLGGRPAARALEHRCGQLIKSARSIPKNHPEQPYRLAQSLNLCALLSYKGGQPSGIEPLSAYREAIDLLESLAARRSLPSRGVGLLASIRGNYGMALLSQYCRGVGESDLITELQTTYQSAIEELENAIRRDPLNYELRRQHASVCWNMADFLLTYESDPTDHFRHQAIAQYEYLLDRHGFNPRNMVGLQVQRIRLAEQYAARGRVDDAFDLLSSARRHRMDLENTEAVGANLSGPNNAYYHLIRSLRDRFDAGEFGPSDAAKLADVRHWYADLLRTAAVSSPRTRRIIRLSLLGGIRPVSEQSRDQVALLVEREADHEWSHLLARMLHDRATVHHLGESCRGVPEVGTVGVIDTRRSR